MKPLETSFERIETKYMVSKTDLQDLIEDLKDYLVEDNYPTSTISNIYFDTEDFQLIQESLQTVYEVDLNPQVDDFQLTSYLTSKISQCDVSLTKKAKKKKNL